MVSSFSLAQGRLGRPVAVGDILGGELESLKGAELWEGLVPPEPLEPGSASHLCLVGVGIKVCADGVMVHPSSVKCV